MGYLLLIRLLTFNPVLRAFHERVRFYFALIIIFAMRRINRILLQFGHEIGSMEGKGG